MSDLISKSALVDALTEQALKMSDVAAKAAGQAVNYYSGMKSGYANAALIANVAPTIDPVKHGEWITKKDACGIDYQICSNCETEIQWRNRHGVIMRVDMQNLPYCPNCGAKMERSEE